jgi:glycosyltransferase involved in cell wall biosynthesis
MTVGPNDLAQSGRPLRVLQLAAMLHNGGVERWLVDLCSSGGSQNLDMEIAVIWETNGIFAERARDRGIPVYHCPNDGNPLKFIANLRRLLREHGPYDAIHCHLHAFSSLALLAARLEGVPIRIAHGHNVVGNSQSKSFARRGYMVIARVLLRMFATTGLAPCAAAAEDLFGPAWRKNQRWGVLACGIDMAPFRADIAAESSRKALDIPSEAFVLGSVGRLTAEKNSAFLVDVLLSVLRIRRDAYLLLIGEGPMREQIQRNAYEEGCGDRVILPGTRTDVPALMRNVMDIFVFPSPPPPRGNEALPIAVVEAQAAGLPTVLSDGVTDEAILVSDLVIRVGAAASPGEWAEAIIRQARSRDPAFVLRALDIVEHSDHNCAVNIRKLAAMYRNVVG